MSSSQVVQVVGSLAWPATVLVALILLHNPLASALSELGRRATRLDLRVVAFEFRQDLEPDWRVDITGSAIDVRHLTSDSVFDTPSMTLFKQLADATPTNVLVIDLGNGREWLTTRLYLFCAVLERMRGVRCIVILRTKGDRQRQVIGTASPEEIREALIADEPWLEPTYISARYAESGVEPKAKVEIGRASADMVTLRQQFSEIDTAQQVAQVFIRLNQRSKEPADNHADWQAFESSPPGTDRMTVWEHTRWINPAALPRTLSAALDTRSTVQVDPTGTQSDLKKAILLQEGPFVTLVESDGTLRGVVERATMLNEAVRVALGAN